jgi:membrane fusion protein (multidrug efflux system)
VTAAGANAPLKSTAMIKPFVIIALVVAILLAAIVAWHAFIGSMIKKGMAAGAAAPQTVSTAVAASSPWQAHTKAVGSLRAVRGADLAAQASGVVEQISFDSGNDVPKGKVLLRLRANDDPAKLEQLQASAALAEVTLKRDQEQLAAQAISQATVDSDVATAKSAKAQVAAQQALIDEKIVRAPFAGRLGIRLVDEGQYLAAGTTVVTLQALDPIFIDFYVPQQALAQLKSGEAVTATVDTYPGVRFRGTITSINSKVDSASRNVQVRASFANADRRLVPGMYATVDIDTGAPRSLVTLPQTAISYNPYGDTVYVLEKAPGAAAPGAPPPGAKPAGTPNGGDRYVVQQRFVKLGPTRGDQVAVESGIVAGDVVVTSGQLKLHNGASVVVNNSVQPSDNPAPNPPNE